MIDLTSKTPAPGGLPRLPGFSGELITPSHLRYDDLRRVFNGMIDRRPALIARPRTHGDVAAALRYGLGTGLPIAVRAGGHAAAGFAVCDDGLVIDLRLMRDVVVDPARRLARVRPGSTWARLDEETQRWGLAVTGGRVSSTGVAGFTLGSGSGWLERKLGYAADNLISALVLTAEGEIVRAGEDENQELFWALRGGGGNFGIVLEFEFRLHPVGPVVHGGMRLYPAADAERIVSAYRDCMEAAPPEQCGGLAFITAPPEPFVPDELRGRPAIAVTVLWAGAEAEARDATRGLDALGTPAVDLVGPMSYVGFQRMLDAANPPGMRDYFKAGFLEELSDETIAAVCRHGTAMVSPLTILLLQPLGGAIARAGEDDTALGHRSAKWAYQALSLWPRATDDAANLGWTRTVADDLRAHARDASFPNFISEATPGAAARAYGPKKYARLVAVKDRYDPANVFRLNHNIPPSVATEDSGRPQLARP